MREFWMAAGLFVGFMAALLVASKWLPGRLQDGPTFPDGTKPVYRLNGFLVFIVLLAVVALGVGFGGWRLGVLHDFFWPLFAVANGFSLWLTLVLRWQSRQRDRRLLHGLWYGDQYNPTWFGVDLKLFAYRPSLMGLALFNLSFAAVQYERYGHLTLAMGIYQAMTLFYLLSSFQYEHGLLSMWDMIEEKFGFMLIWGDLALVPFFYCIPGYFLIDRLEPISPYAAAALGALYVVGFWLFRGANWQKNRFKRNPQAPIWGRPPQTLDGRLLLSGFWGIGRKLNYTGEILIYLSWTLLTGFSTFWPYLLPLWLASLLSHRARRDDKRCRAKYGELWDRYCAQVRFRMVPFLY